MQQILALVGLGCAVWVIYDAWSKNPRLSEMAKILWTIAAILFSILTAIVYYVTQKMR
ncbi:MAG: PLDc N-terminal domain-containing protein [Flavobacteriales bacterium]|nr:PLDc N-terminal domain-containing protein [Flavobacteriales bacterium]